MGIYVIGTDEFVDALEDFLMGQEGEVHKDVYIEAWNRLSKKHGWNEKIGSNKEKKK